MLPIIQKLVQPPRPLYVISGDERYLVRELLDALKQLLPESERSFNLVVLADQRLSAQEVINQARTLPMFGKQRVVIVQETSHWKEDDWQRLAHYGAQPAQHAILAVYAAKVTPALKKHADAFRKLNAWIEFKKLKEKELQALLTDYLHQQGRQMSPEALATLIELSGASLETCINELQKLMLAFPDVSSYDKEHVLEVSGLHKTYNVFELMDALIQRDRPRLLTIGKHLAHQRDTHITQVVGMLHKLFLYADLAAAEGLRAPKQIQASLGISFWWARNVSIMLRHWKPQEIIAAQGVVYEYARKAVGIGSRITPAPFLLEEMVLRLAYLPLRPQVAQLMI